MSTRECVFEALHRAHLEPPTSHAEIGERFLDLLVAGVDHELVGVWYDRILSDAPDAAGRLRRLQAPAGRARVSVWASCHLAPDPGAPHSRRAAAMPFMLLTSA
jgi:hypothetical protein